MRALKAGQNADGRRARKGEEKMASKDPYYERPAKVRVGRGDKGLARVASLGRLSW